jgi:hypothetical protein
VAPFPAAEEPTPPVEPVAEPEPVAHAEPAPAVTPAAPVEPETLPEYIVPPSSAPEPFVEPPAAPAPLEEEPELGPLPDYVVDPDRPRPLEPVAPTASAPSTLEPEVYDPPPSEPENPLAGLGLKPVTEFPNVEQGTERSAPPGRRRPGGPLRSTNVDKPSEGEPGDEGEEIGWMQGLSNRLSAYSLDAEPTPETTSDDDEPEGSEQT